MVGRSAWGKNPARPKIRMTEAGADARRLTGHLAARCPDLLPGHRVQPLRQILVQNYHWDPAGRLRWRDDKADAGLPPSAGRRRLALRPGRALRPPGLGHPLDRLPRPCHRDLRRRPPQRRHLPVDGPARIRAGQRGHRVLALDPGVRAPLGRALPCQGRGPGPGSRVDRGLQPVPAAFRAGHDVPVDYEQALAAEEAA